jgi:nucleotide-binding universal stress UspA family protein
MSCYRAILVAHDGSPDAGAALAHAVGLARDQHARLVLLTVVPRVVTNPVDARTAGAARDIERSFAASLHEAIEGVPVDVGVESRLVHGKPARRILEIAQEHRCDLIVMGSHGHGRLHGALIGCTSATVLRESTIPVLLVRVGQEGPRLHEVVGLADADATARPAPSSDTSRRSDRDRAPSG